MSSAALRGRLRSLWASLTDPRMDQCLESENVVPSKFLTDNNIILTFHDFQFSNTPEGNLNTKPPLLLLLRTRNIIIEHPIDFNDEFFTMAKDEWFPEEDPWPATQVPKIFIHEPMPFYRGSSLAHYIENWATDWYPRRLPSGYPNLATLCGIHCVANPHALDVETRGFWRYGAFTSIATRGLMSCKGIANTTSLGELTPIVTAMRCRAHQPAVFDEDAVLVGDVTQSEEGNPEPDREDKLAFKGEKRFPVVMVSLVGPQHVRVIYACMDGMRLSIRMSACHIIQPTDEGVIHNIAGVLLSEPLVESTEQDQEGHG